VALTASRQSARYALFLRQNRWFTWLVKSAFAVGEQAMIAGSNFLLNVLVARWLTPEQYGAYAVAFAIYILLISFYQALVLEPMSVLSASLDEQHFRSYLGSMLRIQAWLSGVLIAALGLFVLAVFAIHGHSYLAWTLLALLPTLPAILIFFFLRVACYVRHRPQHATQGAFIYTMTMLLGLIATRRWFALSGAIVFLEMGISAALVSCLLLKTLRPNFQSDVSDKQQWIEHWRFGRWELSSVGFNWISQNISYTLTAGFLGMAQVGAIKAIMTLFLPLTQSMSALRRLLLPHLASTSDQNGKRGAANSVWTLTAIYILGALVYGILVSVAARPLFRLLYGGKFMEYAYLVTWAAVAPLFGLPAHVIDMGLRAIRSPKSIFVASCVSAIACICVTVPLTWAFTIQGAIASIVLSSAILLVIITVIFRRKSRAPFESEPQSVSVSL
jgi:O-antigen/teichoic acid export membrane protein